LTAGLSTKYQVVIKYLTFQRTTQTLASNRLTGHKYFLIGHGERDIWSLHFAAAALLNVYRLHGTMTQENDTPRAAALKQSGRSKINIISEEAGSAMMFILGSDGIKKPPDPPYGAAERNLSERRARKDDTLLIVVF
jgi:hypothetical protein